MEPNLCKKYLISLSRVRQLENLVDELGDKLLDKIDKFNEEWVKNGKLEDEVENVRVRNNDLETNFYLHRIGCEKELEELKSKLNKEKKRRIKLKKELKEANQFICDKDEDCQYWMDKYNDACDEEEEDEDEKPWLVTYSKEEYDSMREKYENEKKKRKRVEEELEAEKKKKKEKLIIID